MELTCEVIQDLLPSYADGLLSEDSRELVEEHLHTCQRCCKMLENMQKIEKKQEKSETGSKNALHKIKRKLLLQRILTAIIAVVLTLCIVRAVYSHWYFNETFLTMQESGMYVENNKLYSTKNMTSRTRVLYVEDGKTELIYAVDAGYAGKLDLDGEKMLVQDFSAETNEASPDDKSIPKSVENVYYLSEKAFQESNKMDKLEEKGNENEVQKIIYEIKKDSKLIWSDLK